MVTFNPKILTSKNNLFANFISASQALLTKETQSPDILDTSKNSRIETTTKSKSEIELCKKSNVIVVSAPSGCGKSTIAKILIEQDSLLRQSISVTSRQKRNSEKHGVDYFFISNREFEEMSARDEFLETTKIYENHYGTLRSHINDQISAGFDVILVLDYNGFCSVKRYFANNSFGIFVKPPSVNELKNRLLSRDKGVVADIDLRLSSALSEIQNAQYYDHIVINDDLQRVVLEIQDIISRRRYCLDNF